MKFVMRLSFYDNIHIVYEHELRLTYDKDSICLIFLAQFLNNFL